jgi:diacylglycerol kinase family enzyme
MKTRMVYKERNLELEARLLFIVFGVSGNRTYGKNKLILPNEENVCAVSPANVVRKFQIKNLFYTGEHANLPEVSLYKAHSLSVDCAYTVPMQYDGEVMWLSKTNFPLNMEIMGPSLKVLHKKS